MSGQDAQVKDPILAFFVKEPLLISSIGFLICTCLGFYREHLLLKEFGINIILYAEIDDFFLAAFKHPEIFFAVPTAFFVCVMLVALRPFIARSARVLERNIEKFVNASIDSEKPSDYIKISENSVLVSVWFFIATFLVLGSFLIVNKVDRILDGEIKRIRDEPETYSIVKLRSDDEMLPKNNQEKLVRISATSSYVFFYGANIFPLNPNSCAEEESDSEYNPTESDSENKKSELDLCERIYILPSSNILSIADVKKKDYAHVLKGQTPPKSGSSENFHLTLDDKNISSFREQIGEVDSTLREVVSLEYRNFTTADLNFREDPVITGERIALLDEGSELEIFKSAGLWLQVSPIDRDQVGWVHGRYVRSIKAEKVPLEDNPIGSDIQ